LIILFFYSLDAKKKFYLTEEDEKKTLHVVYKGFHRSASATPG